MKISVIITTVLVAQVSASFFDVFHGAVLSVQNSFGKLLSDVVTDVKETVDCTILAVEHVLSLSHDATQRYYEKCGSVTNKTDSVSEARQDASVPKVEVTLNLPNNSEYLQKLPAEIDARINETLSKVLGNYKPHNVLSIENVLAKESEKLVGVSDFVKKELDKFSHEVTTDLKKIEKQRDSGPSVDNILQEIKVLEKRELNTKNTSEAREIHQVIDQVLDKLDAIEATEANENIKLEEILKDLESNPNNSFVGLRQQFEEWKEEESRHLSEIKSKIEEHEKISDQPGSYNRTGHGSNNPPPVIFNINMNRDDVEPVKNSQEISYDNTTQVKGKLDNNTSSRPIGDSNKSLISVANEHSSFQNNTFNESGLNNTPVTRTSYSTTESPFRSMIIHPFESPTAVGSSERATLSTTLHNNLNRNDTNETKTNTTLGIINITPVNETTPPVLLLANLDKPESTSVTANKPKTISTNENNSNETVTVSYTLQSPEIKAIKDVILPVKRNTNSGKEESFDSATNNGTVIISAAERADTQMTLTSQSNNDSKDTVISSIAKTIVENTPVNATVYKTVESSTSATNELVTTLITFDAMLTSTLSSINFSTPVNLTIPPTKSSTATINEASSTVTARIICEKDSNNTMLSSTSTPNLERTPISETIQPEESTLSSGKDKSTTELYDTKISSTSLPNVENTPVSVTTQPEETGKTSDNVKSSTVTTKIFNDNDSKITIITSDSSPIVENTSTSATVEPEETTTVSGNMELSNPSNGNMITSTSLPIIESTLINGTIQPDKITKASRNKEFSTETTSQLTTTTKIDNENDSDTSITRTLTTMISTSKSQTIRAIDTKTVSTSNEEPKSLTANSPTRTSNTADDDHNSSPAVVTMTTETISESILQENITVAENDETASITNSPIPSSATLIDSNANTDAITSTTFPTAEITTVIEIIEPVETITPTRNDEPLILTTTPATIPDKVTNEKTDSNVTVTSTTENADSVAVTEIIQTVEFTKAPEDQELLSTSTTIQSAISEIVKTSTVFPPRESIPTSESITASRNEEDLKNSPKLETNTSRTPEILNSPDLNFRVRSPPLTITESAPVNRERLTSKLPDQLNYDTNGAPRNKYEFNAPMLLSDRILQTRQPLINAEVVRPMYGQTAPPITRSLFNDASKLLIPNVPNQQRKIENDALQKAAFDFFDSVDKRLSHSDSPFGPEEDILKIGATPSTPLLTNAPRKLIDPRRMNYENPSYVPTPEHPTGPPYSFGDRAPANTYKPQGLTTHRPKKTAARANNYKSPLMDYDSFFHTPPRNSEAHQRALKEALQLIANSKRSDRIINSIMKNKNKFNERSVFG